MGLGLWAGLLLLGFSVVARLGLRPLLEGQHLPKVIQEKVALERVGPASQAKALKPLPGLIL
jgi:hypothetical protein